MSTMMGEAWSRPGAALGLVAALGLLLVWAGLPARRRIGLMDRVAPYVRDTPRPSRLLIGATGDTRLARLLAPFVAELARYIAAQKLEKPAVIGHSLGGLAALMLAADHPALPGRVMVVDAVPFIGTLFDPAATVESVRPRAEQMRAAMLARAAAQSDRPAPRDCSGVSGEVPPMPGAMARSAQAACRIGNWMAASDPRAGTQAMADDMTTDMRPRLGEIVAPLTVLHASDERAMAVEQWAAIYSGAYAGAKQARLVAVPGAAHFVMLDRPAETLAAIRAFLAE